MVDTLFVGFDVAVKKRGVAAYTKIMGGLVHFAPLVPADLGLKQFVLHPVAEHLGATAGQGVFVTVYPVIGKVFIAMFTYDTERPAPGVSAMLGEPGHRWFTAIGDIAGDRATLEVTLTSGGVFDQGDPPVSNTADYGTVELVFSDCDTAVMSYAFTGTSISGDIPLERVVKDNVTLCEVLQSEP